MNEKGGTADEDPVKKLARREERLSRAQQRIDDDASTDQVREVWSSRLPVLQMTVDLARGKLLPSACREALDLLVGYASGEWRSRNPEVDEFDTNVEANIEAQVLARLFHPNLDPRHPGLPSVGHGPRVIQGRQPAEDQSPTDDDLARSHEAARVEEDPTEKLARWEHHLRMAQQRLADAIAEHDHAAARVEIAQGFVDTARRELLPPA